MDKALALWILYNLGTFNDPDGKPIIDSNGNSRKENIRIMACQLSSSSAGAWCNERDLDPITSFE